MAFIRQVLVIMAKDLRAELRTKEAINAAMKKAMEMSNLNENTSAILKRMEALEKELAGLRKK